MFDSNVWILLLGSVNPRGALDLREYVEGLYVLPV